MSLNRMLMLALLVALWLMAATAPGAWSRTGSQNGLFEESPQAACCGRTALNAGAGTQVQVEYVAPGTQKVPYRPQRFGFAD